MHFDVLVIGAGLSGLSAASLLAKRGLNVATIDKAYCPGGSCGAFKRGDAIFDQGSSMLFGWGEKGFNAHRFLFNCLEESITMIQHELLYCVHYDGRKVRFFPDISPIYRRSLHPVSRPTGEPCAFLWGHANHVSACHGGESLLHHP